MIEVRAMEAADAPRWRALWAAYNRFYEASVADHVTEQTLARLLDPGSSLVGRVAVRDGAMIGFSASAIHEATWDTRAVCYLEDLYVDETARGFGAGRALIDQATGEFLAARGLADQAEPCFRRARETWLAWDATAVVEAIDRHAAGEPTTLA